MGWKTGEGRGRSSWPIVRLRYPRARLPLRELPYIAPVAPACAVAVAVARLEPRLEPYVANALLMFSVPLARLDPRLLPNISIELEYPGANPRPDPRPLPYAFTGVAVDGIA